jgi:arginine N-succinyltransferase
MYVVRPVETTDLAQLEALVRRGSHRVHTLPRGRAALSAMIERSVASFGVAAHAPGAERYTFVLADGQGAIAGTATLVARAGDGGGGGYLAFRKDMMHQYSDDPAVRVDVAMLRLCTDLSGHSQLAGFHAPDPALDWAQKALLARARLLYAALAPRRCADEFFAALPGPLEGESGSPFWNAVGRKFFGMDVDAAETLLEGARDAARIAGVMPHHPVYVGLLPAAARAAIAAPDTGGAPSLGPLCREGFKTAAYVDICDGGPVLRAARQALRCTTGVQHRRVLARAPELHGGIRRYLVCNAREQQFRAITVPSGPLDGDDAIGLTPQQQRLLDVGTGDPISCVLM